MDLNALQKGESQEEVSSSSTTSALSSSSPGLLLSCTPTIHKFLSSCSSSSASQYVEADPVPYTLLRDLWLQCPPHSRPSLRQLLAGSAFVFRSPQPRQKSEELLARLEKLQDMVDRKAYNDIVKDVARNEEEPEYFSSFKDQLGLGLHVIVTMFTGYLVGYAFFRSQFAGNPVLHAAGGIVGMVIGMLVETLLFIIRSSKFEEPKFKKKSHSQWHSSSKED